MQISNKFITIIVITVLFLLWYVNNAKKDISRYKNIIDTYMSENLSDKKSSMKKVRFNLSSSKKNN